MCFLFVCLFEVIHLNLKSNWFHFANHLFLIASILPKVSLCKSLKLKKKQVIAFYGVAEHLFAYRVVKLDPITCHSHTGKTFFGGQV